MEATISSLSRRKALSEVRYVRTPRKSASKNLRYFSGKKSTRSWDLNSSRISVILVVTFFFTLSVTSLGTAGIIHNSGQEAKTSNPTNTAPPRSLTLLQEGTLILPTLYSSNQQQPQQSPPDPPGEQWQFAGPSGIIDCVGWKGLQHFGIQLPNFGTCSGRVTSIGLDPTDPSGNTVYVGAAQGGVWKSTDGGSTWTPLLDHPVQPNGTALPVADYSLAVGAIAVDPSGTVYVGTGEGNGSVDSYYGAGILKSTDGGQTWIQLLAIGHR